MNLEFSKALDPGQTGHRLSPNKTSRPTSPSLLSPLHSAFIRLLTLLCCSRDNLCLPWKARGTLQTLAQPRFLQQQWPLPLVLYIQMGLPMAPLYPIHPTCCAPGGNASLTVKVSGGSGHWSFSALSKCTVKPRTSLVRPCYSSYYLVPWAEVAC